MALNIKNTEVEKLAAEAAELAGESKTEAIRQALHQRIQRLKLQGAAAGKDERIRALLTRFRSGLPRGTVGRKVTKAQREAMLGYGPDGV